MIDKYNKFFDKCLSWFFGEHITLLDNILFILSMPFMFVLMLFTFVIRLIISFFTEIIDL